MDDDKEIEILVKIISSETIKPSNPPSSPPKIHTLSLLDQIFPAFHVPVLLFYTNTQTPSQGPVDTLGLKTSLTQTLDQFFPLAGRFLDESTLSCNNEGIPFIETEVDSYISNIITSPHKLKLLNKFLPPEEYSALGPRPISQIVPLAFQINNFLCGGIVIGCYMLHKLLDISSLATFLNHWATRKTSRFNDLTYPDFDSIVKAFPPLPRVEKVFVPILSMGNSIDNENSLSQPNIVAKSFLFSSVALTKLKAKASSEMVPNPSRFEALAGFIWEQTLNAACKTLNGRIINTTKLSFSVNMRPRMSKPVPKESMGNLITNVLPQVNARNSSFQDLVREIHLALSAIKEKIRIVYEGENGAGVLCQERDSESQSVMVYEEGYYRLSTWCNIGLSEVDFGFGKPGWIIPTSAHKLPTTLRNFIFFTDCSDGIEVWLLLDEKEMKILESNQSFLHFALPN